VIVADGTRKASLGKLFYRLVEQALAVGPAPYKGMVKCYGTSDQEDHNW
jgi:hypothetical protein